MKITVVGAAGMVGSRVVGEAARRGHDVVAVFRTARQVTLPPGAVAAVGDAGDPEQMSAFFAGADAVVAATRPAPGHEHTVTATTTALLEAAARAGVRILVVGGAAPLWVPGQPDRLVLDHPGYVPTHIRPIAASSVAQLAACREHRADWTYLSPPALLEPGARTGKYRRGTTTLLTDPEGASRISAEDFAVAVVDELKRPSNTRHFTVAY